MVVVDVVVGFVTGTIDLKMMFVGCDRSFLVAVIAIAIAVVAILVFAPTMTMAWLLVVVVFDLLTCCFSPLLRYLDWQLGLDSSLLTGEACRNWLYVA